MDNHAAAQNEIKPLVDMQGVVIEGFSNDRWTTIVDRVDLKVYPGEVLGLIGESGAGKSSLGLASMGYARAGCRISGGTILFEGQDLRAAGIKTLNRLRGNRMTYVAQSAAAAFNPAHRLIRQTIETSLVKRGWNGTKARRHAIKLFGTLRLPGAETIGSRFPHQVSGGQLQRVMTAMAMVPEPGLIVFDEPTTALDVTTQVDVLLSIKDAMRMLGSSAIYISHDLAVVSQMADRIKVLRHGKEVEEAETQTMINAPKDEYTRSLWAVRNIERNAKIGTEPRLTIQNLTAYYGKFKALDNVSLTVPVGRTVSILGESGSGKSTLARCISGVVKDVEGQVTLAGKRLPLHLKNRNKEQLRRVQMIFQMADTALNPRQTVGQIILRPLRWFTGLPREKARRRMEELLSMVELGPSLASRYPEELSGGQKQRVCIARALAPEPEIMICDEVTSALDQLVQEDIIRLLNRVQEEMGTSYIFITHDVLAAKAISDEVIVMSKGRIVDRGSRDVVFSPPFEPYTEKLVKSVPEIDSGWLEQFRRS